jgi:hypothetical protein
MSWYCFRVTRPRQASVVAENLHALARDPLTVSLMSPDVQVYRRRENGSEVFYFSPAAFLFFKPFIATYQGTTCDRPVATHDQHELMRLSLKSEEVWQVIPPGGGLGAEDSDFPH